MKAIKARCVLSCNVSLVTRPGVGDGTTGEQGKALLIWNVASLGTEK